MIFDASSPPVCARFRTETIFRSKIRFFDFSILVGNLLFFWFIVFRCFRSKNKLNRKKPLLFTVISLILVICFVNLVRCSFSMILTNQNSPFDEILFKTLWLVVRFTFLATELSLLLFGVCFARVLSDRQALKTVQILLISFFVSTIYTTIEAILEFRGDTRPIQWSTSNYNLYAYGGMKFLLVSSSIFLLMYIIICFLPCLCRHHQEYLPARRSFYFYCFLLALINLVQVIGTILNITETTVHSVCIVDGTTWIFSIFFAPFVYYQFVRRALSPNTIIPQVLYTDYTTLDNDNRTDDDEDDPLIDYATNQMLDGRFDDITSSTKVI